MENRIKYSMAFSVALYLITSFIMWDVLWISNLPKYNLSDRFFALFVFCGVNALAQIAYNLKKLNQK